MGGIRMASPTLNPESLAVACQSIRSEQWTAGLPYKAKVVDNPQVTPFTFFPFFALLAYRAGKAGQAGRVGRHPSDIDGVWSSVLSSATRTSVQETGCSWQSDHIAKPMWERRLHARLDACGI